ncbi:Protein of unknown function [Streptomyces zhaozhouensis]|uniref:DUF2975 domain-containing protein n=1 Tax=Streptomyces zhaozhouensis TaxID=1300267 RepID=A0A286E769_9ACTN|nr:DUF2975 domain-containing protein [Streptomyces zhaozhouensis]SOD66740.1 Protein of unknown function [Streptomyces zhaozhouensis]
MTHLLPRALRAALVAVFALALGIQALTAFLAHTERDRSGGLTVSPDGTVTEGNDLVSSVMRTHGTGVALYTIAALLLVQVVVVCVWRVVTLAQNGEALSSASLPYLTVTVRALAGATVLLALLAVRVGDAVPLSFTLYPWGTALAAGTGTLVMLLLRTLLHQAIERDDEATRMHDELKGLV